MAREQRWAEGIGGYTTAKPGQWTFMVDFPTRQYRAILIPGASENLELLRDSINYYREAGYTALMDGKFCVETVDGDV